MNSICKLPPCKLPPLINLIFKHIYDLLIFCSTGLILFSNILILCFTLFIFCFSVILGETLILGETVVFAEIKEYPLSESADIKDVKKEQKHSGYLTQNNYPQAAYLAQQFEERIKANEDEIRFLINEKEWLQNRIYHLQDLNESVPWNMYQSMTIKETKIRAAFRENNRLNELLKQDRYKSMTHGDMDYDHLKSDTTHISSDHLSSDHLSSDHFSSGDFDGLKRKFSQEIKNAGLDEWLHLTGDGKEFCKKGCFVVENTLPILYSSGSSRLAKEYKVFFKRLAKLIKHYDVKIRIDGFADVDKIRSKKYPSNFELGATRAANIVHELVKNGVKPSVFQIATTGKYRLFDKKMSNKKSLERRSEISIVFVTPA